MPSYKSIRVDGLKCGGNGVIIILGMNEWFSFRQEDSSKEANVGVMLMIG